MGILNLLGFFGDLLSGIVGWWHDRQVKNDQRTEDQRDQSAAAVDEVSKASGARGAADRDINAGGVRKPDADTSPRGGDGIS